MPRLPRTLLAAAMALVPLAARAEGPEPVAAGPADVGAVKIERLTVRRDADGTVVEADGKSWTHYAGVFSPDGTKVLMTSSARNLVPGKNPDWYNQVYLRDLSTGGWTLVSSDSAGNGGNGWSHDATFSPDGTQVAYSSCAVAITGDPKGVCHIIVKDLNSGASRVLSRSRISGAFGDDGSFIPLFSPDGRRLAFVSHASNLVAGDTNSNSDIFLVSIDKPLEAHLTLARVSVMTDGTQRIETPTRMLDESWNPVFSPDGGSLAFVSGTATDHDVFIKTLGPVDTQTGGVTGVLEIASVTEHGEHKPGNSQDAAFLPDSSGIVFASDAALVPGDDNGHYDIYARTLRSTAERPAATVRRIFTAAVGRPASFPAVSPNGIRIAFRLYSGKSEQIYRSEIDSDIALLVSRAPGGGEGNSTAHTAVFSPDGRHILFSSTATNLVEGDTNDASDVFLATLPDGTAGR